MRFSAICIPSLLGLALLSHPARAVPPQFTVQGVLKDVNGAPLNKPVNVSVSFYDNLFGGALIAGPYSNGNMVTPVNGFFTSVLKDNTLTTKLSGVSNLFMEVTAGNDVFPRQPVTSDFYAFVADTLSSSCVGCVQDAMVNGISASKVNGKVPAAITADTVTNGVFTTGNYSDPAWLTSLSGSKITGTVGSAMIASNFSGSLSGDVIGGESTTVVTQIQKIPVSSAVPADGQVLKYNAVLGRWVPGIDNAGGGVASVGTGLGLSGGPITQSGTIDLALFATGGLTKTLGANGNQLGIAAGGVLPAMLQSNMTYPISVSGSASTFSTPLTGDASGGQMGTAVTVTRLQSVPVSSAAPANGMILKFNSFSGQWEPSLTITMMMPGVLSVGASSPLMSSGGQNPVISLAGPVPVMFGGTGLSMTGNAGNFLRSDGSVWQSGPIAASDLDGMLTYLQIDNSAISGVVAHKAQYKQVETKTTIGMGIATVMVSCGGNDLPISGGCYPVSNASATQIVASYPEFTNGSANWFCQIRNTSPNPEAVVARVICYAHP